MAGLTAAGLSLVQGTLGLPLAGWAAPGGDSDRAGFLFGQPSRVGVKRLPLGRRARTLRLVGDRRGRWRWRGPGLGPVTCC